MISSVDPTGAPAQSPLLPENRQRVLGGTRWLLIGLFAVYAAWFVGPFGVYDLYEYAQNAETLWLSHFWDMRLCDPPVGAHAYSRFSIGLPILSGPFVYAGCFVEWLSNGHIGRRWIMAMMSPLAFALACVLLERIGVLVGQPARACRWAAIMLGSSAAALAYTRCYFVEPVVAVLWLLGLYAFLRAAAAGYSWRWLLLSGAGAGLALMCHYANLPLVAGLGVVLAWITWTRSSGSARLLKLFSLGLVPCLVMVAIMGMNWHCYGSPLVLGYNAYDNGVVSSLQHRPIGRNLLGLGRVLLSAPWVLAVVIVLVSNVRCAQARPWEVRVRWVALAVLLALIGQQCFWMSFLHYWRSPLRYDAPWVCVAALGLPGLAVILHRRWPTRGLTYATLVLVILAVGSFLSGNNDFNFPLVRDPEDPLHPDKITIGTWYARAAPYHLLPDYFFSADGSDAVYTYPLSPVGPFQVLVLSGLLLGGGACLVHSFRRSAPWSDQPEADASKSRLA